MTGRVDTSATAEGAHQEEEGAVFLGVGVEEAPEAESHPSVPVSA